MHNCYRYFSNQISHWCCLDFINCNSIRLSKRSNHLHTIDNNFINLKWNFPLHSLCLWRNRSLNYWSSKRHCCCIRSFSCCNLDQPSIHHRCLSFIRNYVLMNYLFKIYFFIESLSKIYFIAWIWIISK